MAFLKEADGLFIGNFSETVKENGKYFKVGVMFSTGTHRGVEYTREDIKQLAQEFNAEDFVPVQIDHSESARDTVGYIREVYAEGDNLMGKLEIIDEEAQRRIDKGLMKKLSVSFYLKQFANKVRPFKIREVSLVAFPQVKGAQLFSETSEDFHEGKSFDEFYEEYCKKHGYGQEYYDDLKLKEIRKESQKRQSKEFNSEDTQDIDAMYEEHCKKFGYSL
ncbi:hypothetical protein [Priestia megaterium]|uniref:hypothetical protein n=1 Tax=Priestia megaterium TaxID=1404 RepID=UPI00345AA3E7